MSTHTRNACVDLATRALTLTGGRIKNDTGCSGDPRPLLAALQSEN